MENKFYVFYVNYFTGGSLREFENHEGAIKFMNELNREHNITKIMLIKGEELT